MAKKANTNTSAKASKNDPSVIGDNLSFYASEAYKRLRTNVSFCPSSDGHCRVIGVTSSLRGEGKSTTSINLALSLAQDGKRVMLIDGDMRLSTVADRTGVARKPGLSNLLAGITSQSVVQQSPLNPNLLVIAAGEAPPNPSELLGRGRMASSLDTLKPRMDYIVIDLPPITEVVDALVVAPQLDGMVMVVRRNYATKRSVNTVVRQLEQNNINLLGFVMTYDQGFNSKFGKYGYGKSYGYYKKES